LRRSRGAPAAIRDDALACLGKNTGGWTDEDIEEFADEINRHLR
jgi:hypothetical protein